MIRHTHKQILRDTLLPLSVLIALFRLDWDPVLQHHVQIPEFHDIIVGQSVALTETNFHNWYNAYDDAHLHPKSINSTYYTSSVFQELHSLYQDRNRTLNNLRQQRTEIIALLLDQQESRSLPSIHNFQNIASSDENNEDINHNIVDSPESFEEQGAAAPLDLIERDALSPEDIDIIEMLWAQDIDMGVSRDDSNPFKAELQLEKEKAVEEPEKPPQDTWQYSIDGETGEYLPIFTQPQQQQPEEQLEATMDEGQVSPEPDGDISFAECLQLLDDFEDTPTEIRTVHEPLISTQDIEQRWLDLADSIPELLSGTTEGQEVVNGSVFQNTSWNQTVPSDSHDVFAFNATTNGNVNLQNATDRSLQLFGDGTQQLNNSQFLTIDTQDSQVFSSATHTMNNETDLFSPINRLNNMNLNESPSAPLAQSTTMNLTSMPSELTAELNLDQQQRPRNGSLLLELLNSPADSHDDEEPDEEIGEFKNLLDEFKDEESVMEFMSDDNSSYADTDEVAEGATGYNLQRDFFKKGKSRDGYRRGVSSPCESESGSTSSFDSLSSSSQKFSESIQHNHTYASSSDSNSHKASRSSNNTYNSSSEEEFEHRNRPSRDERRANALNIPFAVEKIINLPVDAFNDLIKKHDLNDAQMQLIRDIRRRGKNKVAAQNCRKRKISAISVVEHTVVGMQSEHDKLLKERDKVFNDMHLMQKRYDELYRQVFQNMRDRNGHLVDPNEYQLEVMDDGSVILVPRTGSSSSDSSYSSN